MEPLAVDVCTAAQLLSVSPHTIRKHIRLGRIDVLRFGRRVLIPVESLKRMAAGKTQGGKNRVEPV